MNTDVVASNLVENLSLINMRSDYFVAEGITKSCFKTDWIGVQMVNNDDLYVLGFDHGASYFQHAILVLEDLKE